MPPFHFKKMYATIGFMQELKAKTRTELGKSVKNLRKEGLLPAVVYGEGVPSQPIAVPFKEFEKAYKEAGESSLVKLDVDGKPYNVLIHDISHDPIKGQPTHADFYAVRMDKVIRTKVELEFVGESPAVKNEAGILVKVMQELEIEALPQDLPPSIKVDISVLAALETRLLIQDLKLPKGVKPLAEADEIVALIETPRSEAELEDLKKSEGTPEVVEVKTEAEIKAEEKAKKTAETEAEKKQEKK